MKKERKIIQDYSIGKVFSLVGGNLSMFDNQFDDMFDEETEKRLVINHEISQK